MQNAAELFATAERLRKDCQRLQLLLALLERDINDEGDACLRHLEKATQLRRDITEGAQVLAQSQRAGLPAEVRDALGRQIAECRRLLQESGDTSARLARDVGMLQTDLDRKLHDVRRGSSALGRYKASAHTPAECIARAAE